MVLYKNRCTFLVRVSALKSTALSADLLQKMIYKRIDAIIEDDRRKCRLKQGRIKIVGVEIEYDDHNAPRPQHAFLVILHVINKQKAILNVIDRQIRPKVRSMFKEKYKSCKVKYFSVVCRNIKRT